MKYVFVCGNIYHLYLSNVYRNYLLSLKDCRVDLILSNDKFDNVAELNSGWSNVYPVNKKVTKGKLDSIYILSQMKKTRKKLKSIYKNNENICTIVFIDHTPVNRTIIKFMKELNTNNKVLLVEEGLGLYTDKDSTSKKSLIKGYVYKLFGIDGPSNMIQGENPRVDAIIAKNIQLISKTKKEGKKLIQQSEGIFSQKYIEDFSKVYFGNRNTTLKANLQYDFIYIGQNLGIENESIAIKNILKLIPSNKSILIKPHPREDVNKYQDILRNLKNCRLIDNCFMQFPVELITQLLSINCVLTPYSSAGLNLKQINNKLSIIYLFKIFNLEVNSIEKLINELQIEGIFIVDNLEDLLTILSNLIDTHKEKGYSQNDLNKLTEIEGLTIFTRTS